MRAGKNVWHCEKCGDEFKGESGKCPKCGNEAWAKYPESRVHGDKYEYYEGNSQWEREANISMKNAAHNTFCKRNNCY